MTEVQKLGLKDFIVLKIFDAVWMLLEYPLKFLLLNLRPQGRYRMVFGYHFVQNFDPGFCHLVSGPPLVPEFCIGSASLLPSSPDHSVGVWRANQ